MFNPFNSRLDTNSGQVHADADKVMAQARKYKSYYITQNELGFAVWGIQGHNVALFMGTHYNPEARIDRFESDNE